nr:L-histidine N(alpha)-methyltransferase [Allomuricauda sp.]
MDSNKWISLQELKDAIFDNQVIPMKYLYYTDEASRYWQEICKKPDYTFFMNSKILLKEVSEEIIAFLDETSGEFDIISLGIGNGIKITYLLESFCARMYRNNMIDFYPIEISPLMMKNALDYIHSKISIGKFNVVPVIGDFNFLKRFAFVYPHKKTSNLFVCLGNSIGNSSENLLMNAVKNVICPGDFFLVEINTDLESMGLFSESEINNLHNFSPLKLLGVEYENERIKYSLVENESVVRKTKSVLAEYGSAIIDGIEVKDIKLSIVHRYAKNEFCNYIKEFMGMEIVEEWSCSNVMLYLFKKS